MAQFRLGLSCLLEEITMSLEDLGLVDYTPKTLLIDGDIIIYQPCCIFNEDDDLSRRMIKKYINSKIEKLMLAADCDKYIMFVTTNFNFRDQLVDDYKANREDKDRPVNLAWAKRWCVDNLNNHYHKGLEADDLLGIYMNSMEDCVLWSIDKDLRQIPGDHLDDATGRVINVSEGGQLIDKGKKTYFDGTIGLYYQMLVGDSTDYIVGCGKREPFVYKSGEKKGQTYIKRNGVGNKEAVRILSSAALYKGDRTALEAALDAVISAYKSLHGEDWQQHLETQANLLFMVRNQSGELIQRWTYDGREEYFDLVKGVIVNDNNT